jgi:hypothetical protein
MCLDKRCSKNAEFGDIETRKHEVCKPVKLVYIHLSPDKAGTSGYIWMTLRQGAVECTTVKPTWNAPQYASTNYFRKPKGCVSTFDESKKIDIWIHSDSSDYVYIDGMGVKTWETWHHWKSNNSYVAINSQKNNGWYTTDN